MSFHRLADSKLVMYKVVNHLLIVSFLFLPLVGASQLKTESIEGVKGIRNTVNVWRDLWGVNHIYAENEDDLFFTQGYCAARDRLFQLELWRRQATGTLAEILGPSEIKRDISARLFKYRGDMEKELNHYHKNGSKIINSFVQGINAYIEEVIQHPERLPTEFKILNTLPGKWTPEVVITRFQGLKGNAATELQIGKAVAIAGADVVKDLTWFHPRQPDLSLDSSFDADLFSGPILELYHAMGAPIQFRNDQLTTAFHAQNKGYDPDENPEGSNNWIVSGRRTESGFPHMVNDPHRRIALPSLRYLVHLHAPGWNIIGAGEPTIPGISIGHNDYGAWGLTVYFTDAEDIYVYDLNPDQLSQYRYKGKWKNMEQIQERIAVKGGDTVTETLSYTLHGPVTYIDTLRKKAFAIRCAWLEPGGAPYLASLRMNQSKTWKQFRDACAYSNLPGENMIWADRKGNIGWQVVGIAPIRKRFSGMVPVPGDGRYEWSGYRKIKKRPHIKNPKEGYFASANANITPDSYKYWNSVGYLWSNPYRNDRIHEVLSKDSIRTLESEKKLQTDYFCIPAKTLVPFLRNIRLNTHDAQKARDMLQNWDYVLSPSSIEAGIYVMWERAIYQQAGRRFIPDALKGLISLQLYRILEWIENPDLKFGENGNANRDLFLKETFESAIQTLNEKYGDDMVNWKYGQEKYMHVELKPLIYPLLNNAQKEAYAIKAVPKGGYNNTVNATSGWEKQTSGASFRIITDLSDWDKTLMINTPGQSEDPESPFYRNLFPIWADNEYFPAYFTAGRIKENAYSLTILKPVNQ